MQMSCVRLNNQAEPVPLNKKVPTEVGTQTNGTINEKSTPLSHDGRRRPAGVVYKKFFNLCCALLFFVL